MSENMDSVLRTGLAVYGGISYRFKKVNHGLTVGQPFSLNGQAKGDTFTNQCIGIVSEIVNADEFAYYTDRSLVLTEAQWSAVTVDAQPLHAGLAYYLSTYEANKITPYLPFDGVNQQVGVALSSTELMVKCGTPFSARQRRFYKNIVVLGASIMDDSFAGRSLTVPDVLGTAYAQSIGLDVDVYGYANPGDTIANTLVRIQEAFDAFPENDTLFFIHTGGNNVTDTRPYNTATQQELDDFNTDLDAVFAFAQERAPDVVVGNLTFRSYNADVNDTSIFYDESLGSAPYNELMYEPRIKLFNPEQMNSDGNPILDLYNIVRNNYQLWLLDGKHLNAIGIQALREFILQRLGYFVANRKNKPEAIIPAASINTLNKIIIAMGGNPAVSGVNHFEAADIISSTSVPLVYINGDSSGASISASTTSVIQGTNGFGTNTGSTNNTDVSAFDFTLYNNPILTSSIYCFNNATITYTLSGLTPNASYTLSLAGSRNASQTRITNWNVNGLDVTYNTTENPPSTSLAIATVNADVNGNIVIVQSTLTGDYSYCGGIEIVEN